MRNQIPILYAIAKDKANLKPVMATTYNTANRQVKLLETITITIHCIIF